MAIRDPHGVRPLVIGRLPSGGWVFASETCALDIIGADYIRDVEPGELVVVDEDGHLHSHQLAEPTAAAVRLRVRVLRSSGLDAVRTQRVRPSGARWASSSPTRRRPTPTSSSPSRSARRRRRRATPTGSGFPYADGIVVNRYVGRTFIQPTQSMREQGVRMKLNPMPEVIEGKRLVVVDDSIFRGTTTREVVEMLRTCRRARGAPARELAARPVAVLLRDRHPEPRRARRRRRATSRRSASSIGADSLGYLSIDGMLTSTGVPTERFCHACFSGGYPIEIPEETARTKNVLEARSRLRTARRNGRTATARAASLPVVAGREEPLPGIERE